MATVNLNVQQKILDALAELGVGEQVVIPKSVLGKQWELVVTCPEEGRLDLTHRNPGDDGTSWFYTADTTGDPYGAMKFDQEPSLGIPCREAGIDMDGKLVGVIVLGDDDTVTLRASWSNLVKSAKAGEQVPYSVSSDGEVFISGQSRGFIHAIFLPDKKRMKGWVPIVRPGRPEGSVKVLEMEEMALAIVLVG